MAHTHSHGEADAGRTRRLFLALGITALYMVAEAIGGWLTNSLALMADAGHMLADVGALTLTISAIWFGARPATARKTFGYYRLEVLAACVNGLVLLALSAWVIYEAKERWAAPPDVSAPQMTLIAFGGLLVNIVAARLLHSGHHHDLNMHGAWLHVMGDMLGSAAAIVAGVLIMAFGYAWADPLSSVLISVIIIAGSLRLIYASANVLLESTPVHIDLEAVEGTILETEGVAGVHDLHVWTISSGKEALSAHISHGKTVEHSELLSRVRGRLHDEFGIDHLTIQMETIDHDAEALYICETGSNCFVSQRR